MSGFVGWWEVMSAEEAVIEHEIEQIRELCQDISRRISRVEYFSGERVATDSLKEMFDTLQGSLDRSHIRICMITMKAFDKHWERNGDK